MSNSGYRNSGNLNSGYLNSGYRNSGNLNSGYLNSGNRNSGYLNSGDLNSGDRNSGNLNSGNRNSGYLNSGDRNSGYLCTETPSPTFFDQPTSLTWAQAADLVPWVDLPVGCAWVDESSMSDVEKAENPNHTAIGGYLKVIELNFHEAWQKVWPTLNESVRQQFLNLPNFDADKFLTITGVDVREPEVSATEEESPAKRINVNGHDYVLETK